MKNKIGLILKWINLFGISALWIYGLVDMFINFKTAGKWDVLFCLICMLTWNIAFDIFGKAYEEE